MTEYALCKGDDLLIIGTLTELADFKNVTRDTILLYTSASYRKRTKEQSWYVIKIEED
ncbi:hypothetical protein M4H13_002060 [Listeria monocytogenes]|uniref:hypothetical protein n=1 Tax=Listeria monocytogenes TaxID=1639 RepID=UPI001C8BCB88|nr:hypothetical protein [Listeria monocytogenes]EJE1215412.1 hypothetical protein [Listeria monocytogenes]EJE1224390.1 hypothetical protein [Listeria monocytogenes]EJE1228101.1 hypothetical protein [Listeria monocytogenes]EJE1344534.1 hypothetical protein [Listeria monocytogenes]EJE2774731.1 hypothetical protein [Listeria monocytogenes]